VSLLGVDPTVGLIETDDATAEEMRTLASQA
jgi:hypothetical protein